MLIYKRPMQKTLILSFLILLSYPHLTYASEWDLKVAKLERQITLEKQAASIDVTDLDMNQISVHLPPLLHTKWAHHLKDNDEYHERPQIQEQNARAGTTLLIFASTKWVKMHIPIGLTWMAVYEKARNIFNCKELALVIFRKNGSLQFLNETNKEIVAQRIIRCVVWSNLEADLNARDPKLFRPAQTLAKLGMYFPFFPKKPVHDDGIQHLVLIGQEQVNTAIVGQTLAKNFVPQDSKKWRVTRTDDNLVQVWAWNDISARENPTQEDMQKLLKTLPNARIVFCLEYNTRIWSNNVQNLLTMLRAIGLWGEFPDVVLLGIIRNAPHINDKGWWEEAKKLAIKWASIKAQVVRLNCKEDTSLVLKTLLTYPSVCYSGVQDVAVLEKERFEALPSRAEVSLIAGRNLAEKIQYCVNVCCLNLELSFLLSVRETQIIRDTNREDQLVQAIIINTQKLEKVMDASILSSNGAISAIQMLTLKYVRYKIL